ncbi:ABC transporter permease [Gracilibacillus oryzae]|uniref:ABC transporter permease n=2 Tax=Gracilibacillus oryzae TaxID=1672701 RepID=A0A7C8GTK5_9BACI|nr:ABC transporter permease [Gracilibacillus oryzae]
MYTVGCRFTMEGACSVMRDIIAARFLLLKKNAVSLIIWLLAPLLITILFLSTVHTVQDDFRVPVGVVLEEETPSTNELYEAMEQSSFVTVSLLSEREAIRQVQQHELDSAFVIKEGYEEQIQEGNRRDLLESYYSDRSFAYNSVKEMIVSIIQQETGRIKAANTVIALERELNGTSNWTEQEIIAKSRQIQAEEDLLNNEFRYMGEAPADESGLIEWNPWMIWAFAAMLFTIFLFDWVIKEQNASVNIRIPFTKVKFSVYMLINLAFYIILLVLVDLITYACFYLLYEEEVSLLTLLSYRMMTCILAFLIVTIVRKAYLSYILAITLTITLVILSGALLPLGALTINSSWIHLINPVSRFLSGEWTIEWLIICIIGMGIWYVREERKYA